MTMNINIRKFITLLSLVITQRDVIAAHFRNLETRISINTTKVDHLGWVRATFSGIPVNNYTSSAWIGVFYPASANVSAIPPQPFPATPPFVASYPMNYIECSLIPRCATTGSGSIELQLFNVYSSATIWLFGGTLEKPVPLAKSQDIVFRHADAPLRGHLLRTSNPREMRVVWHQPTPGRNSRVRWGFQPGQYSRSRPASFYTYNDTDLCGEPATTFGYYPSHYHMYAVINDLVPGSPSIVYYIYGNDEHGWSEEQSFRAAPEPVKSARTKILLTADLGAHPIDGTTHHWPEPYAPVTMGRMRDKIYGGSGYDYSLVLHPGDVSYATGYLLKWEMFMDRLKGLFDRVPYMVGLGNHERDYPNTGTMYEDSNDSGGECGIPTTIRFPSPDASHSDLPSHGWWSLQHGSALIIMLNSEMSLFKGSDQYRWLRHTLTHHNRSEAPWIIITIHRPVYGLRNIPGGVIIEEKLFDLEDLIHEQKVDLLIVGHEHNSYVSCPMYKQKCKLPNIEGGYAAPIHLCSGNGGQHITPINATATIPWIQYKAAQFGYSSLEFHNQTHLSITMYSDDPASNFEGYKQTIFRRWPRDKHGT